MLDYVYYFDELGGKPMLFAREVGGPQFKSYEEFLASIGEEAAGERSYTILPHAFDYLEKVVVDGTEGSSFQFAFLALLGDQFYLSWHALYNDFVVLCELRDAEPIAERLRGAQPGLSDEEVEQVKSINYEPTTAINGDAVTVRMVVFSNWGGFWENLYVMDRQNPYHLLDMKQNVFMPYDCGTAF